LCLFHLPSFWVLGESGRSFNCRSTTSLAPEEVADIDLRYGPDFLTHFKKRQDGGIRLGYMSGYVFREDADNGEVVLRTAGRNYDFGAYCRMGFPDGRWFKLPVRRPPGEYDPTHAVMSAVSSGETLVRYRYQPRTSWVARSLGGLYWDFRAARVPIEIVVSPGVGLDDRMVLAVAVSASELTGFFTHPGGG
jgi:hypothetical protein